MKKFLIVITLVMLTLSFSACSFLQTGEGVIDDGETPEANDDSKTWIEDSLDGIAFEVKDSWESERFYADEQDVDDEYGDYNIVEYMVRSDNGDIAYTFSVFREGDKTAKEIVTDDDYAWEDGVTVDNYKYKEWEQGKFKGYADSWTARYTDDAVYAYENEYYYSLTIHDHTSWGQGVVFDHDGSAYTVNYELYSTDKNDKAKAISYLNKIIKSLKEYDGSDDENENNSYDDDAVEV